ncbi:MAG: ABC transporter substrate-binding protein [Actinomycetes bacterium]
MPRTTTGRSGRLLTITALFAVLALVLAACGGGRSDDNGGGGGSSSGAIDTSKCPTDPSKVTISGDTITLGTSIPQSGIYSAFKEILAGSKAYIDYMNEELGGVEIAGKKYKVNLVAKDDAYEAAKTVANVQSLLDEGVFGLFNVVGTKNNLAIRDQVNEECVPSLLAATGSPAWGNRDYPWLLGTFLVPYPDEMKALVDYLEAEKPEATIAVLRANDDFGAAYSETLESLVKGTKLKVVKVAQYDPETPDTKSQVTTLAATKADVLVLGATLLACPDALKNVAASGWKPMTYMSGTCTSKTLMTIAGEAGDGVISVTPLMDPANPDLVENAAMKLYKEKIAQYGESTTDPTNGIVAYGWTAGAALQHILESAGAPNRLAVMEAARTTTMRGLGLMPDGAEFISNIKNDWFLGEDFTLVQYSRSAGYFTSISELQDLNGETASFTPKNLIDG